MDPDVQDFRVEASAALDADTKPAGGGTHFITGRLRCRRNLLLPGPGNDTLRIPLFLRTRLQGKPDYDRHDENAKQLSHDGFLLPMHLVVQRARHTRRGGP